MKDTTTSSIIMRLRELGESDLLVTFFTPDRGQIKGIAKAARKSRKRFANCLETFSLVNMEYTVRGEGGLCFIQSGKLLDAFSGLRCDFGALSRASYMVELTEVLFPSGVADQKMFELLRASLDALSKGKAQDLVLLCFEARALALGGYAIRTETCCFCGRTYTGSGTAVFTRERGAIACLRCRSRSPQAPLLGPESVRALEQMQKGLLSESGDPAPADQAMKEICAALRLHREYRLEHRLKTVKYIE